MKLTPPGLPRWNQVFALLDFLSFNDVTRVVQKPASHRGMPSGVASIISTHRAL